MSTSLIHIIENLGEPRILVVGDLILDRYIWGNAERISQEAPVILLRADRREERLGGAASVATMLAALGARASLAGVLGDDATGRRCRELLGAYGIEHDLVLTDPTRPSTCKERFIGRAQQKHPQQILRVDAEVRDPISRELVDRFVSELESRLDDFDIVLVSDYDKGVCVPALLRRLIDACRSRALRIIVDPIRGGDYAGRYHGCSTMTPNRLEAELATGRSITDVPTALDVAEELRARLEMEVGVVTLDRDGMVASAGPGMRQHFAVRPRQVYDITGAGDMVLAMFGMVLAAGHGYPDAIALANTAGGLEVERIGVATLTRQEILVDLLCQSRGVGDKLVAAETLDREMQRRRGGGERIVFTNGCFDLLHAGHVAYLREAKAQGDVLVVGLNTDASVRRLGKGTDRPLNGEAERAIVLGAIECVDYVCLFDESTPLKLIELVRPDVLVKGADYAPQDVVGRQFVEAHGGRLHLAELRPGLSTSKLIEKVRGSRSAA